MTNLSATYGLFFIILSKLTAILENDKLMSAFTKKDLSSFDEN
jgi:hypothetical protein